MCPAIKLNTVVNGVDITTIASWASLFSIDTVGSTRGALTIRRNLTPAEQFSLHFEADLVDNRLGVTHHIVTDEIVLSTVDKSLDSYGSSQWRGIQRETVQFWYESAAI